jgi:predicted Zn-dependent protease
MTRLHVRLIIRCVAALWLAGCVANPVTGKRELRVVSEAQEVQIGQEHYVPTQQMQGGQYNVDPELTRYVQEVGQKLAQVSDRQLPYDFVVLNNSTPNAWALPGGKIAVNRGLLTELNDEAELAAVLGHEIVHAAARHGAKGIERGMVLQGVVVATGLAVRDSDYATLLMGGAQVAAGLITQKYGRDAERESDLFGMRYMSRAGYAPQAAVSLQEVFVRLSADRSKDWLSGLFASHPPSEERVENNKKITATLPPGGERYRQRYQQKIAHIKRAQPAYAAHDEGRKELAKGEIEKAISLADQAIRIEPQEAQFHALLGDARFQQQRYREALPHYQRAIERHDAFFHYYVQRGMTHQELENPSAARADLDRSMKLLPTASAANALGQLALASGNPDQALKYFQFAANSDSPPGRQAAQSLVRLDLPRHPYKYLKTQLALDSRGYVVAQVTNPTPVPIRGLRLVIQYPDAQGRMRQSAHTIQRVLRSQEAITVRTGLGPVRDQHLLHRMRAGIDRASVAQ